MSNLEMKLTDIVSSVMLGQPVFDTMHVNYEGPSYFVVIDKKTLKEVSRFEGEFLLNMHTINSFEQGDIITIDVTGSEGPAFEIMLIDGLKLKDEEFREYAKQTYPGFKHTRIEMDLNATPNRAGFKPTKFSTSKPEVLEEDWMSYCIQGYEYPMVAPSTWGKKPTQVIYGSGNAVLFQDRLYRIDLETGEKRVWMEAGGYAMSEEIVLESPDNEIVLAQVMSNADKDSDLPPFLVFLDGETLEEIARAEFHEDLDFAFVIHGTYVQKNYEEYDDDTTTTTSSSNFTQNFILASLFLAFLK